MLGLAGLLGLAGCGAGSSPTAAPGVAAPANRPATAPGTLAARTTAQTELGLLSGGDYGHAWDLWAPAAQQLISRADFITLNTTCPTGLGIPSLIVDARPVSGTEVVVDWERGSLTGTLRMLYLQGVWRVMPGADEYRGGLAALLAARRAAHQCRPTVSTSPAAASNSPAAV